MFCNFQNF